MRQTTAHNMTGPSVKAQNSIRLGCGQKSLELNRVVEVISLFFPREPTFLLLRMKYERKMKRKLLVNSMETTKRDSM